MQANRRWQPGSRQDRHEDQVGYKVDGEGHPSIDLGQFALVLGGVKAPVEGCPADASSQTLLQAARLVDDHVAVVDIAGEEGRVP